MPPLVAAGLLGCREPADLYVDIVGDYWSIRADCGLTEASWPASSDAHYETIYPIDEICAEALGSEIGLDWDDFGAEPHDFEIAMTSDEGVIAALFTLIAPDLGTVADLHDNPAVPDPIQDELALQMGYGTITDADPSGAYFWYFVTHRISSIVDSSEVGRVVLWYDLGTVHIGYMQVGGDEASGGLSLWPVEFAAALMHEAAHWSEPDHIQCPESLGRGDDYHECDEDWHNAYGVQAAWLDTWIRHNASADPLLNCLNTDTALERACDRINDQTGFTPCLEPAQCDY